MYKENHLRDIAEIDGGRISSSIKTLKERDIMEKSRIINKYKDPEAEMCLLLSRNHTRVPM